MADTQWNRVSNLEPAGPKAKTLSRHHRCPPLSFCYRTKFKKLEVLKQVFFESDFNNTGYGCLVVRSRLRDRMVPSSKPNFTEDPVWALCTLILTPGSNLLLWCGI
ncbi:hypothetical protein AVEN_215968-1 [Araneus ventricosus]|uniref:Uncharacterized protein n=1 Tax=Araneus ventricosus TaxID=182803 RepID=A0A4Y2L389_ARAVE|nr:hypothetical protein AVEN_215968-1 [Araneus ventricosus]